ncbi:MAG TPA: hypothetical protein EYP33_00395 [Pyrodictium sp.]|nr:hypothetical protein [Pyrodictium sp.]
MKPKTLTIAAIGLIAVALATSALLLEYELEYEYIGSSSVEAPVSISVEKGKPAEASTMTNSGNGPGDRIVMILGTESCPHCRAMISFFKENFPGRAFFCEIANTNSTCRNAFSFLVRGGVTMGVPTMVVCDKSRSTVEGIIIGELKNVTWWQMAFENGVPGSNETVIPVYAGEEPIGTVRITQGNMTNLYDLLCSATLADAQKLVKPIDIDS